MDEYRPYPAEQPEETAEHEMAYVPQEAGAEPPAAEAEGEAGAGDVGDRTRPERQAPDLEHPGGHLHGTVARMNRPRRFGFLRSDDGVEVFFHASALEAGPNAFDALRPGQEM